MRDALVESETKEIQRSSVQFETEIRLENTKRDGTESGQFRTNSI